MATQTQQDEAWNAVLDEMETWERLRHQPDCPRDVQIQLDDLLSQAPLIKAAPDLLAALKECEAFLWGLAQEADQDNDPDWAENGPTYTLQVHVKDALAKAET